MAKKITPAINTYVVISSSIEGAIPAGIRKFLKYHEDFVMTDEDIASMAEKIHDYIMLDLDEVVDFGGD